MQSFDIYFVVSLNKLLKKHSISQWFEMPLCSCDLTVMVDVGDYHWYSWFRYVIGLGCDYGRLTVTMLKVRSQCAERTWAGAGGKLASTQIITCVHTCAVAELRRSGGKIHSATNGSNTQFSTSASKRALQTIFVLKKWQIHLRPLLVCLNIPVLAERECQNPAVCPPQPLRACVNVALDWLLIYMGRN